MIGDFHFERTLNAALTRFMESDFTDILLIDSDEGWRAEDVFRIIMHPHPIVAGSYRMKNAWDHYVGTLRIDENGTPYGEQQSDGTYLLEAERIPGGFTRFKRHALQMYADAYPELHYHANGHEDVAFFTSGIEGGEFYSHDYLLSRRWREMNVPLWIDPMIKIDHYGTQKYAGDLDAHLRNQGKTEAAFQTIADMAALIEASR